VTWIVLSTKNAAYSQSQDMQCPYANQEVQVCHLY
jgi:hypothetical protein